MHHLTFRFNCEARPDGHYVDSRIVHDKLPRKVKKKIGRKTLTRRLAEKGYLPERKLSRTDTSVTNAKKRVAFATPYKEFFTTIVLMSASVRR